MKTAKIWRRVLSLLFAFALVFGVAFAGTLSVAAEENANVARIGNEEYATLGAALTAATAGDTITLISNTSGNVTVDKDVTIDGSDYQYTGTMTLGAVTATVKNVKFVQGEIVKTSQPIAGNFTVKNCSFFGSAASGYAIKVGYASSLTIEDCTSENVSFLYVPYSLAALNVSGVKIENASWGVHLVSINVSNFTDVNVSNSDCGIVVQNTGNKTVNITDSTIEAEMPVVIWEKQTNDVSINFKGDNLISDTDYDVWAIYNNNYVTDRASDYGNVNVEGALGYIQKDVATVDGVGYKTLKEAIEAANALESATVTLLQDVTLGEKLTVSGNVTVSGEYTVYRAESYTGTLFAVSAGATLTLDGGLTVDGGNDYTFDKEAFMADADNWNELVAKEDSAKWFTPVEGAPVATAFMITTTGGNVNLYNVTIKNNYSISSGVVSVGADSTVTLEGAKVTHVASTQGNGVVVSASGANINVTVNEGTVVDGNHAGGNHGLFRVYSGAVLTMNGGMITNNTGWNSNGLAVGVYWGSFYLNGGTISDNVSVYGPANGRNAAIYLHSGHVFEMTGGTISYNSGRARGGVDAPYENGTALIKGGKIVYNESRGGGSTYDVLGTTAMKISGGIYTQDVSEWLADGFMLVELGDGTYGVVEDPRYKMAAYIGDEFYESFWDAYEAAVAGDTIVLLKTAVIDNSGNLRLDKKINIETAAGVNPALRVQGNGTVHIWNINIKNESGYAIIVGDSDAKTSPELHIHGGKFEARTSVVSVTSGTLYIDKEGGEFMLLEPEEYGYVYLLNCIDANYPRTAKIVVYGGTFHNWNPADNAAEGRGTNFCANGYTPRETAEGSGVWTVHVYKKTVVAPTCTEAGYTLYTCERCNDTYTANHLFAHGHSYDDAVVAPTFNELGYTNHTCKVCGHSYNDSYLPALVAVAEVDGVKFGSLKDAIEYCKNGETVKLLATIVYDDDDIVNSIGAATNYGEYSNPTIISIGGTKGATPAENKPSEVNAVIDLNGYSIINNAPAYLFIIMDNAKLTFKDSVGGGKIDANVEAPVIWVIGSETLVTIESGYYETDSDTGLLHSTHAGDLVIKGGEFKTTASDASLLVMINSTSFKNPNHFLVGVATVSVEGGLFYGFNPARVGDDKGAKTMADIKFVNGCAEGFAAVEVEEGVWSVISELEFKGARLLLKDGIGIYFMLRTEDIRDELDYVAVFTYVDVNGVSVEVEVAFEDWKNFGDGVSTGVLFDGIEAREMNTEVSLVIFANGYAVSEAQSISVRAYAEAIIAGNYTAEAKALAMALLNYGAQAQISLAPADDKPEGEELVNYSFNAVNEIGDVAAAMSSEAVYNDKYYGASLNLNSYLAFNFKFRAAAVAGATHAEITYGGKTVRVDFADFRIDDNKGLVIVTLAELYASDAALDLTCTVYSGEEVLATATDSVYNYCARAIAGLSKMDAETLAKQSFQPEFYRSLILYLEAARAYDESTQ